VNKKRPRQNYLWVLLFRRDAFRKPGKMEVSIKLAITTGIYLPTKTTQNKLLFALLWGFFCPLIVSS
jgi:hypothetical protein